MVYLFILTSRDFIPNLPLRFQTVGKYVLLLHIPMILVFNLLGSFATLTYRELISSLARYSSLSKELTLFRLDSHVPRP